MYKISKSGKPISLEDWPRWCKCGANGMFILCPESDATHIVVENSYIESLENVEIETFSGSMRINALLTEGADLAVASTIAPPATVGVLSDGFDEWKPGTFYEKQYSLFTYQGKVGFTRQPKITAMAHQPPFSTGMESIYGVRPAPDNRGVYPYVYNMAASVGMLINHEGIEYECIQAIDIMLFPPAQLSVFFKRTSME